MQIPENATKLAESFTELDKARKQEIISHLAQVPDGQGPGAVTQIIKNGGSEGRFVATIFGKPLPAKADAPQNKSVAVGETK